MRSSVMFVALTWILMSASSSDAQYRRGRSAVPGAGMPFAGPHVGQRNPMSGRLSRHPEKKRRIPDRRPRRYRRHWHPGRWRHPWNDWYWRYPYRFPGMGPYSYPMPDRVPRDLYYQTSDSGEQPYSDDIYASQYVPDEYYGDAFAAELAGWDVYSPYYETYPVEFAYTPADAPQRAPVVHPDPDRPSIYSIILPRPERKALHEMVSSKAPHSAG